VCCECPLNIEVPARAVDARQDARVVPANVEEEEPLEIHVAVDGGDHQLLRSDHRVEGAWVQIHSFPDLDMHRHQILPVLSRKRTGLSGVKVDIRLCWMKP